MPTLNEQHLETCRKDTRSMNAEQAGALLLEIPDWEIRKRNGTMRLQRNYRFKNFADALDFSIRIGNLAEQADHHPTMITEWGQVTLTWWTHGIRGLHRNDFIMAARCDRAYRESE